MNSLPKYVHLNALQLLKILDNTVQIRTAGQLKLH